MADDPFVLLAIVAEDERAVRGEDSGVPVYGSELGVGHLTIAAVTP